MLFAKTPTKEFTPPPFLVFVILVAAVIGSFQIYDRNHSASQPIVQIATTTVKELSEWKTFRSEKYNFEFKYPDNVGVLNDEDSSFVGPPVQENEDMLLIADKEKTFHIQIIDGTLHVIKRSVLGDTVISTFRKLK